MQARGFRFTREGWVDTGMGNIVVLHPDGTLEAGMLESDGDTVRPEWR